MVNNFFNLKQNQSSKTTISEVNTTTINQVNYLQKIIGNNEVSNLIQIGIIHKDRPVSPDMSIIASQKKKEEYEGEQIQKDKDALMEDIEKKIQEKKEEADTFYQDGNGPDVYVNVKTNIVYAEIPGNPPLLFYHYIDLVDVTFSKKNIEKQEKSKDIKRGRIVPYIFSFKYKPDEDKVKTQEDQEPEEKGEEKKVDKKDEKSPQKKSKTDEVSATIFKEQGLTDKIV